MIWLRVTELAAVTADWISGTLHLAISSATVLNESELIVWEQPLKFPVSGKLDTATQNCPAASYIAEDTRAD